MGIEEIKNKIKANIEWGKKTPPHTGGQQCGVPRCPVTLKSEDLNLEITIGYHRSQLRNKELAFTLFELALDDLVR